MKIPVIDIFAGPGGLGEGFSSVKGKRGKRFFDIKLSIEMDKSAHETLELRSFFRQFPIGKVPQDYYEFLKTENPNTRRQEKEKLFDKFKNEGRAAMNEAWHATLGKELNKELDIKISSQIKNNEPWVLLGGPPCQAYSNIGRSRVGGIKDDDNRVYLYREYLRIIAVHQPSVFVMENVKGLLSAKVNGKKIFQDIIKDLKRPSNVFENEGVDCPDYKIFSLVKEPQSEADENPIYGRDMDFLIKSENYGIPQKRHRVILVGIRSDISPDKIPVLVESEEIPLNKIISDLPKLRSGISREILSTTMGVDNKLKTEYRKIVDNGETWKKLISGHSYAGKGFSETMRDIKISVPKHDRGGMYISEVPKYKLNFYKEWYSDPKLKGICNHETRAHLKEDLERYFFAALFVKIHNKFPRLKDYPLKLLPHHQSARSGKFTDRFRVQMKDIPATTITSHISKDGHYFIHYDPSQCRSLTVREAARIQTFPDNYYFCGSRTSQYIQVGNAVPPLLAFKIGNIVKKIFMKLKPPKSTLKNNAKTIKIH